MDLRKYNDQIISYLQYINKNILTLPKSTITYGAFNALIFGRIIYDDHSLDGSIDRCINFLIKRLKIITDNHDALILIGLSCYLKHMKYKERIDKYFNHLVGSLISSQTREGFFQTGDIRAFHHQRTMYVLWGLAFASQNYLNKNIKRSIEKSLDYVWGYRRDGVDNAFLWHPKFYFVKYKIGFPLPVFLPRSSGYLYECHQTFFVNAIKLYEHFFNEKRYEKEKRSAMEWIFGKNRIGIDLRTVTGIDLPVRIMNTDGIMLIRGNMFKGSYEVGSYIFALTN